MKHFLHISDYNESELREILNLAKDLKEKFQKVTSIKTLDINMI